MAYKNPLALYNELIAAGVPEAQAQIQAQQDGELGEHVSNIFQEIKEQLAGLKTDMDISISMLNTKIDIEMKWVKTIGSALCVALVSIFVKLWVGH
jgi:hypothetical protein